VPSKKTTRDKGLGSIFYSESKHLWVARIELPARNGNRRRKEITAKTQPALLEKMREPLGAFHRMGDLPTSSTRLDKYLEYWLTEVAEKTLRPNTTAGYRTVLVKHVIPEIGHYRLDKITPAVLRRVTTRITSTPKNPRDPSKGFLSSTYALLAHHVMSRALKHAERDGLIPRNPATLMDAPKKSRTQLEALTVDEAKQILRMVVTSFSGTGEYVDPLPARWATYLLTGARRGEILGLELDRVTDSIELSWQLTRIQDISTVPADFEFRPISNGMYWTRPKSSSGWRVIPLVEPLKSIIETHIALSPPNRFDLVFPKGGMPIDPDVESKTWREWLARSGITDKTVRLHDLRHTTVDLLYAAGISEDLIMEIVGHSTRGVTRGYKSRENLLRREQAMKQLSSFLGY
jgi:integrase